MNQPIDAVSSRPTFPRPSLIDRVGTRPDQTTDAELHEWYEANSGPVARACPFAEGVRCDLAGTWECDQTCRYYPYDGRTE